MLSLLIVGGAFLLRIYRIGSQELWLDEAASLYWAETFSLGYPKGTPLYLFLLRLWIPLAGDSETGLRLLSAIFGILFVGAVIWAGTAILNRQTGLWSGMVAAVSPIHIYYSQEGRAYALMVLGLVLTYGACWRAMERESWHRWAALSTCACLTLYTHYLAVFGLAALGFLTLLWPQRQEKNRRLIGFATAMIPSVALFGWYLVQKFVLATDPLSSIAWVNYVWTETPPLQAIPKSIEIFGIGSQAGLIPVKLKAFSTLEFPLPLRLSGLAVLLFLLALAVVPGGDRWLGMPWAGRRKAWLLGLLLLPLGALWTVSFVKPIYVAGRYDMVAFPAFVLLIGFSLAKAQNLPKIGHPIAFISALILCIVTAVKLNRYYQAPSTDVSRQTAAALIRHVQNGDVVVFTGLRGLPTLYYLHRADYQWRDKYCENTSANRRFACRMYPTWVEQRPAVFDRTHVSRSISRLQADIATFLGQRETSDNDLWVVFAAVEYSLDQGYLKAPPPESFLVKNLVRAGLQLSLLRTEQPLGIFRFRRPR